MPEALIIAGVAVTAFVIIGLSIYLVRGVTRMRAEEIDRESQHS